MKIVNIQELTIGKFAPYGTFADMIDPKAAKIGEVPIEFYRDMGVVTAPGDSIGLSVVKVYKRPLIINIAEYHDNCGEAILPLNADILIHVAPATAFNSVPYDDFEVFRIPCGTLVVIRPGVWHHGPFCIEKDMASILVVLPERTYVKDCKVVNFTKDRFIEIV